MAGGIAAFCDRWQAAPRQRYFVSMAAAETCSAFLEQAPGHIAEIQITLVALEDGDFELHIRDNTDFFDSFSAQADRLGGKGTAGRSAIRRASHQPPGCPEAASAGLLLRAGLCHRLRGRAAAGTPAAGGIIVRRTACGKPRGNGLSGSFFCPWPSKSRFFRRPTGTARPAANIRAARRHLRGRQCKPVCLRVRGVFPHRGRGHPCVFTGAAPAAQCCAGNQRRLRGCCRAGRAGGALRLLRRFESARPFSLVPDTAFFRGCVLPARPAAEPGTALFLFAGVDPALRALFAGQSGCLQQPFSKGRANFPAAARCGAAGFCLSVRSTLQGSTKPL